MCLGKDVVSDCVGHKMAEGHIEFTLSGCVYLCVFSSVVPESCPAHKFVLHGRI